MAVKYGTKVVVVTHTPPKGIVGSSTQRVETKTFFGDGHCATAMKFLQDVKASLEKTESHVSHHFFEPISITE